PAVEVAAQQGCIDGAAPVFRHGLLGTLPNRDYVLEAPAHDAARLGGGGETYAYEARCAWAFEFAPASEPHRSWKRTSELQFEVVQRNLHEGLRELCHARRAEWKLS